MTTLGKYITLSTILLLLLGCATKPVERTVYVTTPLHLPTKPELPRMSSDSLSCVSDETKWALLKRDVLIKNYISDLETIITSTKN
jgi:hypothetical protein